MTKATKNFEKTTKNYNFSKFCFQGEWAFVLLTQCTLRTRHTDDGQSHEGKHILDWVATDWLTQLQQLTPTDELNQCNSAEYLMSVKREWEYVYCSMSVKHKQKAKQRAKISARDYYCSLGQSLSTVWALFLLSVIEATFNLEGKWWSPGWSLIDWLTDSLTDCVDCKPL